MLKRIFGYGVIGLLVSGLLMGAAEGALTVPAKINFQGKVLRDPLPRSLSIRFTINYSDGGGRTISYYDPEMGFKTIVGDGYDQNTGIFNTTIGSNTNPIPLAVFLQPDSSGNLPNVTVTLQLDGALPGTDYLIEQPLQSVPFAIYAERTKIAEGVIAPLTVPGDLHVEGFAGFGVPVNPSMNIRLNAKIEERSGFAIYGDGAADNAVGVYGRGFGDKATGVSGYSGGEDGTGVYGESASGVGVYGKSTSSYGAYGRSESGVGVYAETSSSDVDGSALHAINEGAGKGILGIGKPGIRGNLKDDNDTYGILGRIWVPKLPGTIDRAGVYGRSLTGYGVYGKSINIAGVLGEGTIGVKATGAVLGVHAISDNIALLVEDVMRLKPRSTAPANPAPGTIYYSSSAGGKLMLYREDGWHALTLANLEKTIEELRSENQKLKDRLTALERRLDEFAVEHSKKLKVVGR